ncbi:hypothetical protein BC832DRAFT_543261 [Gaertneriomyces semiglobifer]|nr:hypothetical protein BC832DRAFT_543261 [Gaertneriomyces semiglobifer]
MAYLLTVHVHVKESIEQVSVELDADAPTETVIRTVMSASGIKSTGYHGDVNRWRLYEAEVVPEDENPRRKEEKPVRRRLVRELTTTEYPVVMRHAWADEYQNRLHFYMKEVESDGGLTTNGRMFDAMRREQCRSLSLELLYQRLEAINLQEAEAREDVRMRYDELRAALTDKILLLSREAR